jgi:hypothetical protein
MELIAILAKQKAAGKLVGASGATPSIVLASMPGFLQDGATCFPSSQWHFAIQFQTPWIMMWLCMTTLSHPKALETPWYLLSC